MNYDIVGHFSFRALINGLANRRDHENLRAPLIIFVMMLQTPCNLLMHLLCPKSPALLPKPSSPTHLACALQTVPNLYNPNAATTLNPIGNGFMVLIALGTLLPASTRLASSANSTPYGCLLRMRRPPSPYYCFCQQVAEWYSGCGRLGKVEVPELQRSYRLR